MLTPEQKHRLRRSFALLERQAHVAALVFYQHLFKLDPALRPLFEADIESRAMKLMDKLANALSLLEKPEELKSALEDLGSRHLEYSSEQEDFGFVAQALLSMVSSVLGKDFDAETQAAWTRLCEVVQEAMPKDATVAAAH